MQDDGAFKAILAGYNIGDAHFPEIGKISAGDFFRHHFNDVLTGPCTALQERPMVGKPSQGIEDHLKALIICHFRAHPILFGKVLFTCKDCLIKFSLAEGFHGHRAKNNGVTMVAAADLTRAVKARSSRRIIKEAPIDLAVEACQHMADHKRFLRHFSSPPSLKAVPTFSPRT